MVSISIIDAGVEMLLHHPLFFLLRPESPRRMSTF
jgi:hypothetical protein